MSDRTILALIIVPAMLVLIIIAPIAMNRGRQTTEPVALITATKTPEIVPVVGTNPVVAATKPTTISSLPTTVPANGSFHKSWAEIAAGLSKEGITFVPVPISVPGDGGGKVFAESSRLLENINEENGYKGWTESLYDAYLGNDNIGICVTVDHPFDNLDDVDEFSFTMDVIPERYVNTPQTHKARTLLVVTLLRNTFGDFKACDFMYDVLKKHPSPFDDYHEHFSRNGIGFGMMCSPKSLPTFYVHTEQK